MRSMTGCGRHQINDGRYEVTVELKTVNHRFLDLSIRLPRQLSFLEAPLRESIGKGLKRGHVDVYLTVRSLTESDREVTADTSLAARYLAAARAIAEASGAAQDVTVSSLMRMEGVLSVSETQLDEEAAGQLVRQAAEGAVAQVVAMREKEGLALREDLTLHLDAAAALREKILTRAPGVVEEYRSRLTARLGQLLTDGVDPARLAQEVAIMADRCAIDEELSRLESHIRQLRSYLQAEGEIGKKMDFLIQEMNREANTIGSKANDAVIAQLVVDLKSEIEKLREQIQNVE